MRRKSSLKERLSYRFDTFMSRGTLSLIGGLALVALAVIAIAVAAIAVGGVALSPAGSETPMAPGEAAWSGLMHSIDSGALGGDSGWGFRVVMLLVTVMGIFIFSTLIGVLTAGVESKLEELRKGRSRVLERGHTVILGWSPQIFMVVSELAEAGRGRKRPCIVIMSEKDKVEMEDEIRDRVGSLGKARVICRTGSTIDPAELARANPDEARSVIVLPPEGDDPDAFVVKTVLALTKAPGRKPEPYVIVTQLREESNRSVVRMISPGDHISAVLADDLIARVTAQTSRQSGLSVVYTELLDFGGDEMYFSSQPSLEGLAYGDCLNRFPRSSVMGLFSAAGESLLNPPMERKVAPGDRFVLLAEDETSIEVSPSLPAVGPLPAGMLAAEEPAVPEKCLILNWNASAAVIVRELDAYVAPGSLVTVAAPDRATESALSLGSSLANQRLEFTAGDSTSRPFLESLNVRDYDHVICLSPEGLGTQEADARTLITLLHLRDMAEKDDTPFSIVTEMLDLRNRELAEAAKVDDFIVSEHLVSLMMSQLSENHRLLNVFADLFDPEGAEIYLKPAGLYLGNGAEASWASVVESARARGETAIGYRLQAFSHDPERSYGVRTNPPKGERLSFGPGDRVIVLAED